MKHSSKIILLTAALAMASGSAIAARGFGCAQGPGYYAQGPMQGPNCMQGRGGMRGLRNGGGMGLIYQLDGLTDEQKLKITELRREQHERMFQQREQMLQQRAATRAKIHAVLTEEQRQQLQSLRPYRYR